MKKLGLLIATLALVGCSKPAAPTVSEAEPATPSAPAPELAPEGVFYLLAAARVETPDGVHGLPAGTGVKLVRPGIYLSPAGEVALDAGLLTNDMVRARRARDAAQASQAEIQQRGAAEAAKAAADQTNATRKAAMQQQEALKKIERERAQARLDKLIQQEAALRIEVDALANQHRKESYNEAIKGRAVISMTEQRLRTACEQLAAVQTQIEAATRAIK